MSPEVSPTVVEVDGRTLRLTNLDKILYPATETTKGEVLHYYASVAPRILAQTKDRPVTRLRFPHGVGKLEFFEKNTPSGAPHWIEREEIDKVTYPFVDSVAALSYFANLASLEFHTPQWRWRYGERENPDRIVLDLDPGAPAGLDECAAIAVMLRELLGSLGWPSVPVTSGSKGMQIYARLDGTHSSDDIREFARTLAEKLTEMRPELITAKMTKSLRPGKVFIDWSQNVAAKTTITPWSLRGRNRPFVATPRTWDEIETARTKPGSLRQLDLHDVLDERLDRPDPMDALLR